MQDLHALSLPELFRTLTARGTVEHLMRLAREEDLGTAGDVTTASVFDGSERGAAAIVAREAGVVAGLAAAGAAARAFGEPVTVHLISADGAACAAGETLARIEGSLAIILAAERTVLNLLSRLAGIATLTRRFVDAVADTPAVICATRKTTPGWRGLEKYAVRCGGGALHRLGLYDAALYKDNHLARLGPAPGPALVAAITAVRREHALRFVEVEADTVDQVRMILSLEIGLVDLVLLDNMSDADVRASVELRAELAPTVELEASGGVTLERVPALAAMGVDRISVGALTHSAPALDIGLDIELDMGLDIGLDRGLDLGEAEPV